MQPAFEIFKERFNEEYKDKDNFSKEEVLDMFEQAYEGIDEAIDEHGIVRTKEAETQTTDSKKES